MKIFDLINYNQHMENAKTSMTNGLSSVMVYTNSIFFWGNLRSSGNINPGRILVGNNLPTYLTLINGKSKDVNGGQITTHDKNNQIHIPVARIIAFHIMPPEQGLLDYDESDPVRNFKLFTTSLADFELEGAFRLPEQSDIKWAIESAKSDFMSCYKVKITHKKSKNMKPLEPKIAYLRRDAIVISEI
jgi:hypothetical protein